MGPRSKSKKAAPGKDSHLLQTTSRTSFSVDTDCGTLHETRTYPRKWVSVWVSYRQVCVQTPAPLQSASSMGSLPTSAGFSPGPSGADLDGSVSLEEYFWGEYVAL